MKAFAFIDEGSQGRMSLAAPFQHRRPAIAEANQSFASRSSRGDDVGRQAGVLQHGASSLGAGDQGPRVWEDYRPYCFGRRSWRGSRSAHPLPALRGT